MRQELVRFFEAFEGGRTDRIAGFLHEDAVYRVEGLAGLKGRRSIAAFWNRMFQTLAAVQVTPIRLVVDRSMALTQHHHAYVLNPQEIIRLKTMAVLDLKDGLILAWSDTLELNALPDPLETLWRRLWTARW
ncbi:nuclear transport factor 2 family protein [Brevundimonas sp.]|uniref:nuclear transport factor 2 family protein n=1 Tax=Brevundimonas sp. TaxID=1871086 RepID=UPI00289F0079|nr:nuclear transport factor 2 family protein [Brevundimonas sp.]